MADDDGILLKIDEPLAASAPLAQRWSQSMCTDCGAYHGAWQVLRLLGVLNSLRSDDDFLVSELHRAIKSGASRILVSGAADYALQARIAAVAGELGTKPQVTVVDRCDTPLELNRWYASYAGMDVKLVRTDILDYKNPEGFDLVCTHSFLSFFDQAQRQKLVGTWWDSLAPGGAVLTAQRARPGDFTARHEFSVSQADEFGQRAYRLAIEQHGQLGIEPEQARSLAHDYAVNRSTHTIRDSEQISQLFLQQGFVLEHFAQPGDKQPEKDIPSTPTLSSHHRWRILARKPMVKNTGVQNIV